MQIKELTSAARKPRRSNETNDVRKYAQAVLFLTLYSPSGDSAEGGDMRLTNKEKEEVQNILANRLLGSSHTIDHDTAMSALRKFQLDAPNSRQYVDLEGLASGTKAIRMLTKLDLRRFKNDLHRVRTFQYLMYCWHAHNLRAQHTLSSAAADAFIELAGKVTPKMWPRLTKAMRERYVPPKVTEGTKGITAKAILEDPDFI